MAIKITLWGTRGSIPVFGTDFMRHGGSTTCIEVELLDATGATPKRVVLDMGTGCVGLGRARSDWDKTLVLQTHLHWDHIQGFPFFAPLFNPAASFDFWSVRRDDKSLRDVLAGQMTAPTFPVPIDILPSALSFKDVQTKGSATLGELQITWDEVWHPSGSTAWRLDYRGSSFVFTGDCEVQQGCVQTIIDLAQGADVMVMDAQYFPEEYNTRQGWGHSTPLDAINVASQASCGRLVLTHHDPSHTDRRLGEKLALARQASPAELTVDLAYDGQEIELSACLPIKFAS